MLSLLVETDSEIVATEVFGPINRGQTRWKTLW